MSRPRRRGQTPMIPLATTDAPPRVRSKGLALGVLCLAFFLEVLASTSVFTAGPDIATALDLSSASLPWLFTACTLPAGSLLLLGGRLADRFGARRIFIGGLGLLVISSLICGCATGPAMLLAGRVAQGVSAALTLPAALSLLLASFPEPAERNRALAAWSAVGGIGATAGLVVGGLVTSGLGWRWVFLGNVPIGIAMIVLAPLVLRSPAGRPGRLDVRGALVVSGALAAFVYGVGQVPTAGWLSLRTTGLIVIGLAACGCFVWLESRTPDALLPLHLFRNRSLVRGNVVLFAAGMCADGLLFTLTNHTQGELRWSAWDFALLTSVMTVTSVGAAGLAQRLVASAGTRLVAAGGLVLLACTGVVLALSTRLAEPLGVQVAGMLLFGLGMGASYVAGSIASLDAVPDQDAGVAAGLQNVSFGLGTTLGVATLSTVAAGDAAGYGAAFLVGAAVGLLGLAAAQRVR